MFDFSLSRLLLTIPAVIVALTFHEVAHGSMAYAFGDPTAKNAHRLSLNPLRHLDLMGTIMMIFFHFGWAKPVPVN
ncbi:MAG: site-2 protease family protein, partial [Clostridiales bacterium]